jgi:hypothetical protein
MLYTSDDLKEFRMSNDDLYEIASKRIDRRNRSLTILGIHIAALVAYVGLFIVLAQTEYAALAVGVLVAWGGLFVLHCIQFGMSWSRDDDISGEVAKLRRAAAAYESEKPKRIAVGEDGELVDFNEEEARQQRLN